MNARIITEQFIRKALDLFFSDKAKDAVISPFNNNSDFAAGGFASLYNYHVFDSKKNLLFVAKAEEITSENLSSISLLIPACNQLRQLPLKHSKLILPFYADAFEANDLIFQCVAIEAAPGNSISQLISQYSQQKTSWETLLAASKQAATALSELNSFLPSSLREIHRAQQDNEDKIAGIFALYQEEHPDWFPFTLDEFNKGFANALVNAHSDPFPIGIIHGDSNITNIFYESRIPQISLIDSLCILQSITPQGKPIGNVSQEYTWTLCSFELMGQYYGLKEDQIKQLLTAFAKNYTVAVPPNQFLYYSLLFWMAYTIICNKISRHKSMADSLLTLRHYILQKVKSLL